MQDGSLVRPWGSVLVLAWHGCERVPWSALLLGRRCRTAPCTGSCDMTVWGLVLVCALLQSAVAGCPSQGNRIEAQSKRSVGNPSFREFSCCLSSGVALG